MLINPNKEVSPKMVKHISKIIKETDIYKQLQQRKSDMIQKALFQPVSGVVSEREHKKSVKKPR